jgi:exodeoxyribonuclease VII small subunit
MKKEEKKDHFAESMKRLEAIVDWFEEQEEVDLEAALEKVREGAKLVRASKERLKEIENEFEEIRKAFEDEAA